MLAIAITTAPRPRETFTGCLASMRAAGFEQTIHVHADGVQVDAPGCNVIRNEPALGGLKNWCAALEQLVLDTTAPWVMVCEDDVEWAPRARAKLEHDINMLAGKPVGYLSLYIARKVSKEMESRKGWRKLDPGLHRSLLGGRVWGSQAYALPRATAITLLADEGFDDLRRNYLKNRNRDGIVSGALDRMGLPLYFRVPALCNHGPGNANSSLRDKPVQPSLLCDYWESRA